MLYKGVRSRSLARRVPGRYESLALTEMRDRVIGWRTEPKGVTINTIDSGTSQGGVHVLDFPLEEYGTESKMWQAVWNAVKALTECKDDCNCKNRSRPIMGY